MCVDRLGSFFEYATCNVNYVLWCHLTFIMFMCIVTYQSNPCLQETPILRLNQLDYLS